MAGARGPDTTTVQRAPDPPGAGYVLVVIRDDGAVNHVLPQSGSVTLGRAEDNDIRLDDPSVSRHHARLTVGPPLRLEDLGSRNGVRVRGQALGEGAAAEVAVDEVIGIGVFTLIVQRRAPSARPMRVWSHDYFDVRLDDECTRAARFGWSFALTHLLLPGERSPASTRAVLASLVR
ncbi:MAG TPA: FHA domain-containing protein, partial [Kofleriaceae bacterium]|nr:FHA domain-containing protein [Kofleriaceae bacterium]